MFHELSNELIEELSPIVERGAAEPLTYNNPYLILLQTYEGMQLYDDALKLAEVIRIVYAREQGIDQTISQLRDRLLFERNALSKKDSLAKGTTLKSQQDTSKQVKGH